MRFPLEVFEAVREAFPPDRPVTVRVSGTDWVDGGWDIAGTIAFAAALEELAVAPPSMSSSGGLSPHQKIPVGPSYQAPSARAVKEAISIPVVAVGLITQFDQAEAIIGTGQADMIALARTILYNPRWPWHAGGPFWRSRQSAAPVSTLPAETVRRSVLGADAGSQAMRDAGPQGAESERRADLGRRRFDTGRSGACLQRRPCAQIGRWIEMLLTGDPPWTAQVLRSRASLPNRSSHRQPSFLLSPHPRVIAALPSPARTSARRSCHS